MLNKQMKKAKESFGHGYKEQGKDVQVPNFKPKQKRWKPKFKEKYFVIDTTMKIMCWYNDGLILDKEVIRQQNCFRTRKEAEIKLKAIKKILRGGK